MAKKKNNSKLYILPIVVLFGILAFSSGNAGSYGASANLFLQPTVPVFPSVNYGSFFFAASPVYLRPTYLDRPAAAFLSIDYRAKLPTAPAFQFARPAPILFTTYAVATPVQPVFFTPTRALYDVRYTYDNFAQVLDP